MCYPLSSILGGVVKAAIKKMSIDFGVEVITRSDAPAGSGLGTSASMGVALKRIGDWLLVSGD